MVPGKAVRGKKRVAICVRVSTAEQETGLQESESLEYCERRGWEPVLYRDKGQSGAKQDRPALNQLLSDLRKRKIDVILVWSLDRLARSLKPPAQHFRRMQGAWSRSGFPAAKHPMRGYQITPRGMLKPEQVISMADKLQEPYATLVLFLAITGVRLGEAVGIKWSDFDGDVLRVSRTIYEGKADTTKTDCSCRSLPIPAALVSRMKGSTRQIGYFPEREPQ